MRSLLLFLYLFLVGAKGVEGSDPILPLMEYLDQNHLVCLKWGFDNQQGNITFKLAVNTTGWVGFGLSPHGDMRGADIVIGGVGPNGSYFKDYHGLGKFMPLVDDQQSYTLLSLTEEDGQTIMTFQRSIQSCDYQDFHITAQPIKLIYAYGLTDEISYHQSRRGTKEVNLLNYVPRMTSINLDSGQYINAIVNKITVPSKHTYYHCKVMKFPSLKTKRHIYMIEPVIENRDLVHHMLLYRCPSYVTATYDKPCYQGDIGDYCFAVVAAWGVGGGILELPADAGIPIGGGVSDNLYRLEIHYNNPANEKGRTDSSGLRLHYTSQLRQHDVGILSTGVLLDYSFEYKIPPKAPHFHSYGVCNTTLFSQVVKPLPDLQVFSVLMHTHLAGRKMRVGHYRNGKQIDFLSIDENYNFELQQFISLGSTKTIKEGDEILVECTYSTTNRTAATEMGLATTDEMCLAYLMYYPAINITTCLSHPDTMHPMMNTSLHQMFKENATADQEEIAAYENLLKTVPQIQTITDSDHEVLIHANGTIRDMMKTPTVICPDSNAASRLTWTVTPAGVILLILWIAIM